MTTYYLITKESLSRRVFTQAPSEGWVHASNGLLTRRGMSNPFGFIHAEENGLKECTQDEAEKACWELLGVRPGKTWDMYNKCYRIDMRDENRNIVVPKPMSELIDKMMFRSAMYGRTCSREEALSSLLKYFNEKGFAIINL